MYCGSDGFIEENFTSLYSAFKPPECREDQDTNNVHVADFFNRERKKEREREREREWCVRELMEFDVRR
jgi:hypothetical protein